MHANGNSGNAHPVQIPAQLRRSDRVSTPTAPFTPQSGSGARGRGGGAGKSPSRQQLTLPHPDSDISDDYGDDDDQDGNEDSEDTEGDTMDDLEANPRRSRKNVVNSRMQHRNTSTPVVTTGNALTTPASGSSNPPAASTANNSNANATLPASITSNSASQSAATDGHLVVVRTRHLQQATLVVPLHWQHHLQTTLQYHWLRHRLMLCRQHRLVLTSRQHQVLRKILRQSILRNWLRGQ